MHSTTEGRSSRDRYATKTSKSMERSESPIHVATKALLISNCLYKWLTEIGDSIERERKKH